MGIDYNLDQSEDICGGLTGCARSAVDIKRRMFLRFSGLAAAATLLSGCTSHVAWHQKLKVVVSTPAGEKVGSSVTKISATIGTQFASGNAFASTVTGEATVVEIMPGKYLFALLNNDTDALAVQTFEKQIPHDSSQKTYSALQDLRATADVPTKLYPMLVTFGNVADPASVKDASNLEATFGAGYSLKSITLEITDEPVTQGVVKKVLPWALTHRGRILSPDLRLGPGSHNQSDILPIEDLTRLNFIRRLK